MSNAKKVEVWYDDASGNDPKWCVSLCESDGDEIRCLSSHDDKADAVKASQEVASKQNLQVVVRDV